MAYYKCGSVYTTQNSNTVIDTASGSIANFETPLAMPLLDTQIDVNAVQDLHGQSGAYPPGGSAQKWDEETEFGSFDTETGEKTPNNNLLRSVTPIPVSPNTTYLRRMNESLGCRIFQYDSNMDFISQDVSSERLLIFTTANNCAFINIAFQKSATDVGINYPSTDTAYHPYSNICPIDGWDEISVHNLGGNFFNKNTVTNGYLINASGNEVSYADWNISDYIPVVEGVSYYFYGIATHPNTNQDDFELFDENKNKVGFANVKINEQPYVIPSGVAYIKCSVKSPDLDTAQFGVYVNDSFVSYNPVIEGTVIQLNNTYYGGRFIQDKSGKRKFVVTHNIIDLGSLNWSYNSSNSRFDASGILDSKAWASNVVSSALCSIYKAVSFNSLYGGEDKTFAFDSRSPRIRDSAYTDATTFKTAVTGQKLVYELAEPIIIDLPDGTPFKSLPGVNNIFADTGDTAVKFRKIG